MFFSLPFLVIAGYYQKVIGEREWAGDPFLCMSLADEWVHVAGPGCSMACPQLTIKQTCKKYM